jgi:hypothetical protein
MNLNSGCEFAAKSRCSRLFREYYNHDGHNGRQIRIARGT